MSRPLSLLALLAATATLAACGAADDDPEQSKPPPAASGSQSSGPSNEQNAARVKLTQCLRDQGLDVPDAATPGELFSQLSPAERQQVQDAIQGPCREYQADAFGDASDTHSSGFLDQLTAFTGCLRENGVDVPDPDPAAPFEVLHSLDQSDPRIAKAAAACQDKLPGIGGG